MEDIWLLYREPPASEIIGAYTSLDGAMSAADAYEPGLAWSRVDGRDGGLCSGLWRIIRIEVED